MYKKTHTVSSRELTLHVVPLDGVKSNHSTLSTQFSLNGSPLGHRA